MSKVFKSLEGAQETRKNKYTAAIQVNENNQQGRHNVFNKNAIYGGIVSVILIGFLVLIMSFKTFSQVQNENKVALKLANIVANQNKKIKLLESSLQELSQQQSEDMKDLKKNFGIMDRLLSKNEREVSELAIDSNIIRVVVDDLKATNRDLMDKFVDLSDEVRYLRHLKVRAYRNQ